MQGKIFSSGIRTWVKPLLAVLSALSATRLSPVVASDVSTLPKKMKRLKNMHFAIFFHFNALLLVITPYVAFKKIDRR